MKRLIPTTFLYAISLAVWLTACGNPTPAPVVETTVVSPSAVIAEGRIEPVRAVNLSFLTGGIVQTVSVKIGDQVRTGGVLAELDNADTARVQVVAAQQAYDLLLRNESGDRAELWQVYMDAQKVREAAQEKWNDINVRDIENRIEDRQDDVADEKVDLEQAQAKFDKYRDLNRDDQKYKEAEDELDDAQSEYDEAVEKLQSTIRERDVPRARLDAALATEAEAKYQYELTLGGPNVDQLARARADLDAAQQALNAYVLTAPFDGIIADVNVRAGEQIGPETRVVSLIDPVSWIVETTDVTELEVVKITAGQAVSIIPDALPDVTLSGTVSEISQAYFMQGGDVQYTVRMTVNEIDPRIRWGMTVEVIFETGQINSE